jgi:hypothetical protein
MPDLSHLKIKKAPKALASFAAEHNALVDLIASIEGQLGINVNVASSPRKRISFPVGMKAPKQQPRGKILITGNPTALFAYGAGGSSNGTGEVHLNANGYQVDVDTSNYVRVTNSTQYVGLDPVNGLAVVRGGNSVTIPFAGITRNITLKEIDVCSNGAAKKMIIVASDPY